MHTSKRPTFPLTLAAFPNVNVYHLSHRHWAVGRRARAACTRIRTCTCTCTRGRPRQLHGLSCPVPFNVPPAFCPQHHGRGSQSLRCPILHPVSLRPLTQRPLFLPPFPCPQRQGRGPQPLRGPLPRRRVPLRGCGSGGGREGAVRAAEGGVRGGGQGGAGRGHGAPAGWVRTRGLRDGVG